MTLNVTKTTNGFATLFPRGSILCPSLLNPVAALAKLLWGSLTAFRMLLLVPQRTARPTSHMLCNDSVPSPSRALHRSSYLVRRPEMPLEAPLFVGPFRSPPHFPVAHAAHTPLQ